MKLAVILPIYNAELYLGECLDSLLAQTFQDFTVLAINDASTDRSAAILDEYAAKDSRLCPFHLEQNRGDAGATQFAFDMLETMNVKYVARMDADDICLPERFEKQIAFLEQHLDIDVVGANMLCFDGQGTNRKTNVPLTDKDIKVNFLLARANILNPTSMWRHESINPLNLKYNVLPTACDYAMWIELALHQKRFANLSDVLVNYRLHANQASKKVDLIQHCAAVSLTRYIQALFPELNLIEATSLAYVCAGHNSFSVEECKVILQAHSSIQNHHISVLGEDREQLLAVLSTQLLPIQKALESVLS